VAIEPPRAALTAHRIADAAAFLSFGTNDLTQTTWGFSSDDVETTVFAAYLDRTSAWVDRLLQLIEPNDKSSVSAWSTAGDGTPSRR
jgi:phosphoenolpyruvate synthase/pyruvate phosphate dikinase